MPPTVTDFPVPTFLLSKLALVFPIVKTSPDSLSSLKLTAAVVFPSYGLFVAVALTVKLFAVTDAVVVAVTLVNE